MAHHHEETHLFQHHICIDIDKGIAAQFDAAVGILLYGKLADGRAVVGSVVFAEPRGVGTEFDTEHLGHLELQVEVREDVPRRQRQHILIARVLIGDHVLPVQRTETEVLVQLGGEYADVAAVLKELCRHVRAALGGGIVTHAPVAVVLYLVDSHAQTGVGLRIREVALDMGARLHLCIEIPPQVLGVITRLEVGADQPVEIGRGRQLHGVAEEREVEVGIEIDKQLSGVGTSEIGLQTSVEMECFALCLSESGAHAEVVLGNALLVEGTCIERVGLGVGAVVGRDKRLQSGLHVFVEPFEQTDGEGVLDLHVLGHVVDRVVAHDQPLFIIGVLVIAVGDNIGLMDVAVVVPLEGVDETGDGHELVFHRGVDGILDGLGAQQTVERGLIVDLDTGGIDVLGSDGIEHCLRFGTHDTGIIGTAARLLVGLSARVVGVVAVLVVAGLAFFLVFLRGLGKLAGLDLLVGHLHLAVESDVIAVGEEEMLVVVAVPYIRQDRWNLVLGEVLRETLGVGDIGIVGDAAILFDLLVTVGEDSVHVVFVAGIRTEYGSVEMRLVLVLEIAPGVSIFEVEAEVQALVDVDGELSVDMVLAAGLVAAVVVLYGGIGRERVHEEMLVGLSLHEAVGLGKGEVIVVGTVDEDTAQAGRVVAAGVVVLAIHTVVERGVHEEVGHGVGLSRRDIAEGAIDGPCVDALGNLLIAGGVVVVLVEFVVTLGDVAALVDLVVDVLGRRSE